MGSFQARLTGYWPYKAGMTAAERRMEGGTNDRKGRPIITLGMYERGEGSYVSVAGDWQIFPYGQRIEIAAMPGVVFRVVDTGGHFFGAKKVYRLAGHEPLDIAVDYGQKHPRTSTVTVIDGDNFEGGRGVAYARLPDGAIPLAGDAVLAAGDAVDDVAEELELEPADLLLATGGAIAAVALFLRR